MQKIGIIFGMEDTFPGAVVTRINEMKVSGVTAEFVKIGGVKMAEPSGYRVIIDRISHDIAFYRAYLKNAALRGTIVINNPQSGLPALSPRPHYGKQVARLALRAGRKADRFRQTD